MLVQGWQADGTGAIDTNQAIGGVQIRVGELQPPKQTELAEIGGNLSADAVRRGLVHDHGDGQRLPGRGGADQPDVHEDRRRPVDRDRHVRRMTGRRGRPAPLRSPTTCSRSTPTASSRCRSTAT